MDPAAVAEMARSAGFDFIAITDHNNTIHAREPMPPSPLHIVGEEVTTPGGHATVWGWRTARGSISGCRRGIRERPIRSTVWSPRRTGAAALFSISHPVDNCAGCSWEQIIPDGIDAVEIWQNEKAPRDAEVAFWDRLLRTGRHVTAVGVADWHRSPNRMDMAAVRVKADSLTERAVIDGIRRGHVIVMRDAATPPPSVSASCGSHAAGVGDTLACTVADTITMRIAAPAFPDGHVDFIWNAARMTSGLIGSGATFSMPASAAIFAPTSTPPTAAPSPSPTRCMSRFADMERKPANSAKKHSALRFCALCVPKRPVYSRLRACTGAESPAHKDDLITPIRVGRADAPLTLNVWAQPDYFHLAARPAIANAFTSCSATGHTRIPACSCTCR
jgi:hypothetical protein